MSAQAGRLWCSLLGVLRLLEIHAWQPSHMICVILFAATLASWLIVDPVVAAGC